MTISKCERAYLAQRSRRIARIVDDMSQTAMVELAARYGLTSYIEVKTACILGTIPAAEYEDEENIFAEYTPD